MILVFFPFRVCQSGSERTFNWFSSRGLTTTRSVPGYVDLKLIHGNEFNNSKRLLFVPRKSTSGLKTIRSVTLYVPESKSSFWKIIWFVLRKVNPLKSSKPRLLDRFILVSLLLSTLCWSNRENVNE